MYTLPVPHAWAEMPLFPHMLAFLVYWQEIHIHGQALLYMLFLFLCLFLSFLANPCLPRLLPLLVILIVHPLGFISQPRWIFKEVGSWQFMVNRLSLDTSASVGVLPLFTKDLCSAWAGFRSLTQIQLKTQKHHSLSLNMQLDKDIVGNSKQMPILTTMHPSNCSMICGTWSKFIAKVNWSLGGGQPGSGATAAGEHLYPSPLFGLVCWIRVGPQALPGFQPPDWAHSNSGASNNNNHCLIS